LQAKQVCLLSKFCAIVPPLTLRVAGWRSLDGFEETINVERKRFCEENEVP